MDFRTAIQHTYETRSGVRSRRACGRGRYHLIECHDLDESIAKCVPTVPFGGTIEVRPLEELQPVP